MNEDLIRRVEALTGNLSDEIERLLADYVTTKQALQIDHDEHLDAAIAAWNGFDAEHGSFADEHVDL